MRKLLTLFVLFFSLSFFAQEKEVVIWQFNFNSSTSELEIKATIQEGWHLYSLNLNQEAGPIPTTITFKPNEKVELIGKTSEPQPLQEYDETFDAKVEFFEHEVTFKQPVKVKGNVILEGTLTFMVCNSVTCLPPKDIEFKIDLKQ